MSQFCGRRRAGGGGERTSVRARRAGARAAAGVRLSSGDRAAAYKGLLLAVRVRRHRRRFGLVHGQRRVAALPERARRARGGERREAQKEAAHHSKRDLGFCQIRFDQQR